tara:strand:- start:7612 stop:9069 length:1458 start_codon:yes stop_codon:yes gene_type:complete
MIDRFFLCFLLASAGSALAESAYEVEKIAIESGLDSQIGGMDVLPDGRVFVCFHQGDVRLYDPKKETWSIFAKGLHEPLGLVAESPASVVVMQRPELTRISDTDDDGVADRYEVIYDDFGMTGNYHEFAFGPVRDANGDWFISLNVASNGASIRPEIRGEFQPVGLPREEFYGDWSKVKGAAGRMYSRAPYRGWVIKIDHETGEATPWASGFRSPNGLGFDAEGNLYVSDNQGDWLGTSKLHHVAKGRFHGHPASLPWTEGYDGRPPLEIPVEDLETLRTPAAVWFTQGSMANSPTQPILIPEGFGPFAGQMLIGEMNRSRIIRLMLEEVNGVMQGACVPFLDEGGLPRGVNRLAFGPDSSLWTGHTHLSWAGGEGMTRIRYDDSVPVKEVHDVSITKEGFRVSFTQPGMELGDVKLSAYTFRYQSSYGSPKVDEAEIAFEVKPVSDTEVEFILAEPLKKDFCYEFHFPSARNSMVCYTVREIPE